MRLKGFWLPALGLLLLLYATAWLAPFLAPNDPARQFRDHPYAPPSRFAFHDSAGNRTWLPRLVEVERVAGAGYRVTGRVWPLQLLGRGDSYSWMGMRLARHLVTLPAGAPPLLLLGSDSLGRDQFSRIVHGARFSLAIGLCAIVLTLALGVALGAAAGYAGGWPGAVVLRLADLFLSLPALFLILGLRAVFPRDLSLAGLFWFIVLIFSLVGWAGVARVVAGQVRALKEKPHVMASRACGASHVRILTRHILPFTTNYLLVQSAVLIPAFILGEITLSFLGVGVREPDASWGSLLVAASKIQILTQHPWLIAPAPLIFLTVLAFNILAEDLKAPGREAARLRF